MVEVPAYGEKGKAKFLEFFQGKLKKRIVIGLEPQMPSRFEDGLIKSKETAVSKAPFCMTGLGPGIAEVKVEPLYFPFFEPVKQMGCVSPQDTGIIKFQVPQFFTA